MMKKIILIFLFFYAFLLNVCPSPTKNQTIRRHFIIAVDCSGTFQSDSDKYVLFDYFWNLIENNSINKNELSSADVNDIEAEQKSNFTFFDADKDVVSIFSFGMPGKFRDYIWEKYRYDENTEKEKIFNYIGDSYIFFEHQEDGSNLKKIKNKLYETFTNGFFVNLFKRYNHGITLSHFVYPSIVPKIKGRKAAEEYILIVFSDYKTGSSESDAEDVREMGYILSPSALKKYLLCVADIKSKFYRIDYFNFSKGDLTAKAYKLRPKAGSVSENALLTIESDMNLKQKKYNSGIFHFSSPLILKFACNDRFVVDSVMSSTYKDRELLNNQLLLDKESYQKSKEEQLVTIDDCDIFLPSIKSPSDVIYNLTCKVEIIGHYNYKSGSSLPFSYVSQRTLTSNDIEFKSSFIHSLLRIMEFLLITALVLFLLVYLIYRGRKSKLSLQLANSVTNRFTCVSAEEGTVSLNCDFVDITERQISVEYSIRGKIENTNRFSIPWIINYVFINPIISSAKNLKNVSLKVQGAGQRVNWSELLVKNNEITFTLQVSFSLIDIQKPGRISIQVRSKYSPCFFNIKRSGFDGNISSEKELIKLDNENFDSYLEKTKFESENIEMCIDRFIRKRISHPDLWVGIDPGTNGSCLTLGNSTIGSVEYPTIIPVVYKDNTIVDSLVVIGGNSFKNAASKSISSWEPIKDYGFGNDAKREIRSLISNGANCFSSIKKLLGYKEKIKINLSTSKYNYTTIGVNGLDLQTLLVRGLIKVCLSQFLDELKDTPRAMQEIFRDTESCKLENIRRAVVAIPNNFQLPQIVDMVSSIKNAGNFEEVKYIYEPEGILFYYLSQTYKAHSENGEETIIVFDMGGATINASVFKLYLEKKESGNIFYKVSTLSRLGYAIGGDDIDYAILEFLMHFDCFSNIKDDVERYSLQDKNKTELISLIQEFKVDFVKMCNGERQDSLNSIDNFKELYLRKILNLINYSSSIEGDYLSEQENEIYGEDTFKEKLKERLLNSLWIKQYVYEKLLDATKDMLATNEVKVLSKIDKIIFSGRSTLFPGVIDNVIREINKRGFYPNKHAIGDTEIKTAVSKGACWYGMYDGKVVELDNSRITSSYGIRHSVPNKPEYIEIIPQNSKYKTDGKLEGCISLQSDFANTGNCVQFYQMMGDAGNNPFDPSKRYKVRYLTSINLDGRFATQEGVIVSIDGKVACDVDYYGKSHESNPVYVNYDMRDITKDNDRPYLFSIYNNQN